MIDVNLSLSAKQFKLVQTLIYQHAGIDLPDSKQSMVQGRLAKRLRNLKLDTFSKYLDYLEKNLEGAELVEFINCLTTNKTDFFRENHHFEYLKREVLLPMKDALLAGASKLRIWSAACSTGEEPYSIAMTLCESLGEGCDMAILASDIDTQVLEQCGQGVYSQERIAEVPKFLLHRYFDKQKTSVTSESIWRVKNNLRDLVRFRRINFQDSQWPIQTKFDAIFCRNVMIYFDLETQRKLVERFVNYLKPEGHLIIGHSETLSGVNDRFDLVGNTVYRLKGGAGTAPIAHGFAASGKATTRLSSRSGDQAAPRFKLPDTTPTPYKLARTREPVHPIIVGEIHASYEPKWISTLLGSCVSACMFDERINVGGMNHFMLPLGGTDATISASYGIHAMEMLINSLMKLGADRRRLKAKLFGGGAVIRTSDQRFNVGAGNVDFAKKFLEAEGIPLVACHTGGNRAMHVRFHTRDHKALVRVLDERTAAEVVAAETQAPQTIPTRTNSVTLF